jgi:hypothetical protein
MCLHAYLTTLKANKVREMYEDEDTKDNISGLTSMGFCISKIAFHLSSLNASKTREDYHNHRVGRSRSVKTFPVCETMWNYPPLRTGNALSLNFLCIKHIRNVTRFIHTEGKTSGNCSTYNFHRFTLV